MKKLVSVIIPTYNRRDYVQKAIDSVLAQSYDPIEIIVVDDGSTDGTKDALKQYIQNGRIRFFYQENQGVRKARNFGVHQVKGDLIKFLDSDDVIFPDQINLQVEDLVTHQTDISLTNYEMVFENSIKKDIILRLENPDDPLADFIGSPIGPIHAFLIRKQHFDAVNGFSDQPVIGEDHYLWLRLILQGAKVSHVDYIGASYRLLEDSISSDTDKTFNDKCYLYEKMNIHFLSNSDRLSNKLLDSLYWINMRLVQKVLLRNGDAQELLPNTIAMLGTLLLTRCHKIEFVVNFLGVIFLVKLHYWKNCIVSSRYAYQLRHEDSAWRQPTKEDHHIK